ncbi:MAG TPA: zf-TFIIB domain-containing protein [Candidatus Binatia bacterium]|nr:zf-TFIIB domain-containing protein [Candidatus Binatia bacterium]
MDEKDRLGEKLQDKERAEEDRYFKKRDQELLAKLRTSQRAAGEDEVRELARDRCPRCGARLAAVKHHGVAVEECPAGHGTWVDHGSLETIAQRERDSWLGRYFYRPKPVV